MPTPDHQAKDDTQTPEALSEMLINLDNEKREQVSMGDLAEALRRRSLGAFLLVFSLPCILPFPPFTTIVLGLPLVLITAQMAFGRKHIWLPNFITRLSVSGERFSGLLKRTLPLIERLERAVKPRNWAFMRIPLVERFLSIYMFVVAIVVTLPIPFGNWWPALACAMFGAALSERDGRLMLLSLLVSTGAVLFAGSVVWFGAEFVAKLAQFPLWPW